MSVNLKKFSRVIQGKILFHSPHHEEMKLLQAEYDCLKRGRVDSGSLVQLKSFLNMIENKRQASACSWSQQQFLSPCKMCGDEKEVVDA